MFFEDGELLEKRGHKVIFFSMKHPKNFSSVYDNYFVSNVNYENNRFKNRVGTAMKLLYSFEARKRIEDLIRKEKPDIAHIHNIYHQISPSILHSLKRCGIPIVLTLHDFKMACPSCYMLVKRKVCHSCKNGRYYHCFLKECVKDSKAKSFLSTVEMYLHHKIMRIYGLVDVFISPSQFLRSKLEEMGVRGRIIYLPNFVNTKIFIPQFNWQEASIVYFGRLSKEKGLPTLIDAVKDIDKIALKIIGEGPIKKDLEEKTKNEGVKNVKFLGYKVGRDLYDEIKKSMLTILPSELYENNPLSVIQSFGLGKPVIGARIGGIPELVKDEETGLTFVPGDSIDLREKISYMINNPDRIIEMGKKGRKFVEEDFDADRHYQRLIEAYQMAMKA